MSLYDDLKWRGLIKDKTFKENWFDDPKVFYHGIDVSADSLQVGNLAVLLLCKRLALSGWKTILLVGGGTSLVGDPGGKTAERNLPDKNVISRNVESIGVQIEKLFSGQKHELVNNWDWLEDVKLIEFLRDVGKNFSMSELVQRDFISERMSAKGGGISYAEFSYTLIQGYDFWNLYKKYHAQMQIGGSDQWGNMLSGVGLIRKKEGAEAHVLSMPLVINKATGIKFGKTESGAIWLDAKKTPVFQFYQFWVNSSDEDVEDYLKIFTFLTKDEINQILQEHKKDPSLRTAQKKLAAELTELVHGQDELEKAINQTDLFINTTETITVIDGESVEINSGTSLLDALVQAKLASSNTEARRLIADNAIYINNEPAKSDTLNIEDFGNKTFILRRGKKFQNSVKVHLI